MIKVKRRGLEMMRGGGFICVCNFIMDQERRHNSKVRSEEELKENQR